MAEEAIKKLEEQLNCSICLDTYVNPKLLQCFHVYCQQCLVKLVHRDRQGHLTLTCPTCRQVTPVPADGVAGLPSTFHINHLFEIQESVKKIKDFPDSRGEVGGATACADPPASTLPNYCTDHAEEELKLFCNTCKVLICLKCAIKEGKHHSHEYELINEAFEKYTGEITASLKPMEKQLTAVGKALARLDARCREIFDQESTVEADIHSKVKWLHLLLDRRKTNLIHKLHAITQTKLKGQRDLIETTQARLSSCLEFMKESLKASNKGEVLMVKSRIVKQVKELTIPFQPASLKPDTEADIIFSPSKDIAVMCRNYGQVSALSIADPANCKATGKGLEEATVGEKSTIDFHAFNFKGTPCTESVRSLECELASMMTGTTAGGKVERKDNSFCTW